MEDVSLRQDQFADLVFLMKHPKALLLHEPGCGKTPTVCVKIYARWKEKKRTVWIMPKGILKKNKDELLRFTPLTDEQVIIVDGPKAKQRLADPKGVVFLMGPDRLKLSEAALRAMPDVIGFDVDEYHKCYQGATSQKILSWMRLAQRRTSEFIVMTGTFVNGRLDTTYPAIAAIEPKYYPLGYDQFMNHHAIMDEYDRPVAWRNHARLRQIISRHGIRRLFKDIFGDQPVVMQVEDDILMGERQLEMFEELESTATLELEDMMVDGTMPGVALIRAKQIADHPEAFPDGKGGFMNLLPEGEISGKEERLRMHIQDHIDAGTPFVIFAVHVKQQERIAAICREMGVNVGMMNGNVSTANRAKYDEQFRRGILQGLVLSIEIAGFAYNWQFWGPQKIEVGHCIFASLGYLDGDMTQAIKRFIREKRNTPLRVTVLAYANGLEHKNMQIIERKSVDANKVDPTRTIYRFKPQKGEAPMRL